MKSLRILLIFCFFCLTTWADSVDQPLSDTLNHTSIDSIPHPHELTGTEEGNHVKLVKRTFNHKQQVFLGIGMMTFIALIMTTAQSWNPKN